jgi:hypothetical protein
MSLTIAVIVVDIPLYLESTLHLLTSRDLPGTVKAAPGAFVSAKNTPTLKQTVHLTQTQLENNSHTKDLCPFCPTPILVTM